MVNQNKIHTLMFILHFSPFNVAGIRPSLMLNLPEHFYENIFSENYSSFSHERATCPVKEDDVIMCGCQPFIHPNITGIFLL